MNFFQNMFFEKKHVFWPKMASVTLHIPKDFWWHRIFGSATIFWVKKFWSTWSRGVVHGEVSWPIDYMFCVYFTVQLTVEGIGLEGMIFSSPESTDGYWQVTRWNYQKAVGDLANQIPTKIVWKWQDHLETDYWKQSIVVSERTYCVNRYIHVNC